MTKSKLGQEAIGYAIALLSIAAALMLRWPLFAALGGSRPYLTLFGAIALAVWFARWKPAAVAAVVGFVVANFFLAAPPMGFDLRFAVEFALYAFSSGLIILCGEAMHRAQERSARAEERERRDKESLRVTLASIGDGVIVTDSEGRVTFLNAEAERLTGWKNPEAQGQLLANVFNIVNEETRRPAESPVEKVLRLGIVVGLANHTVLVSRDGSSTPIDDSAAPIRDESGGINGVVLVFRDVSEQRAAQFAKARLAAIVEFSGDAIVTKNLDGAIQTWNAASEDLFGYTAGEIIGKPITLLVPGDRSNEEAHILARLRDGQPSERIETIRIAKDGRHIPVAVSVSPLRDSEGCVIGASKVVHDISDVVAARRALAQEKERLATTLASIGDGVVTTDGQGHVTYLNAVAESLTGWSQSEAAGLPLEAVFRIVNEQTRKTVENPAVRALQEGVIVGLANHTVLITKDGTERPIDDSAAPIRDAQGEIFGCVLVFRDVSERRKVEQAQRESEARYRTALACSPVAIWECDRDLRFTFVDNSQPPITDPDLILGKRDDELMPFESGLKLIETKQRVLQTGIGERHELSVRTDDSVYWFDWGCEPIQGASGEIKGLRGFSVGISDRKQTENLLREQAELLDLAHDAIIVRSREGMITFWSHGAEQTYGWTKEGALGKVTHSLLQTQLPVALKEIELELDRRGYWEGTLTHTRQNGSRIVVASRWSLRRSPGKPSVVLEINNDITERKALEREREERAAELAVAFGKRTEEARRAEKAEQLLRVADRRKDEFLATLAHELRNPLAPLRNALEILRRADDDKSLIDQSRSMMERQVAHMVRLVDDLLDVSRITQGKLLLRKERVDLADVLNAAVETARPIIDASAHELTVTMPSESIHVQADPTRLAQVFANLLNNAAKYTEKAGHIWLTAEWRGTEAAVSVRDTGIGIAPEHLSDIFNLFSQVAPALERSQGGLGIGLSLVKGIIELHGGSIEARSGGPGKGSEFLVRLPIVKTPEATAQESGGVDGTRSTRKFRILVVDDLRDSANSLATMLQMMGHETRTAFDGLEALQTAATFLPNVVLLDIGLPKMNGYETARRIRDEAWGDNITLVALTGWGQEEDRRRSLEVGFDHHLTKPVEVAVLEKLLATLVPQSLQ